MSFLTPNNADTWFHCKGSVIAQEAIQPSHNAKTASSNESLKRGLALHSLAKECLVKSDMAREYLGEEVDGYVIDNEMVGDVQLYCDYVNAELNTGKLHVEEPLLLSNVLGVEGKRGQADAITYNKRKKHLQIFDFKSGSGNEVVADNNLQGIIYALGFIDNNDLTWEEIGAISIHIVQPALGNFSKWCLDFDQLMVWAKKIRDSASDTFKPESQRTPGESQCRYCIAKATCEELGQHVYNRVNPNGEFVAKSANGLPDSMKRQLMDDEKLISAYIKSIKAETLNIILEGGVFEGYKLVSRVPHRKWVDGALETLQQEIGGKASIQKIIGLGEAEKLLGRDRVNDLTTVGKPIKTLVKSSDKRQSDVNVREMLKNI